MIRPTRYTDDSGAAEARAQQAQQDREEALDLACDHHRARRTMGPNNAWEVCPCGRSGLGLRVAAFRAQRDVVLAETLRIEAKVERQLAAAHRAFDYSAIDALVAERRLHRFALDVANDNLRRAEQG
jgi:hypothetical protein